MSMLFRATLTACLFVGAAAVCHGQEYVPGHYERDGTYVAPGWHFETEGAQSGSGGAYGSAYGSSYYGTDSRPSAKKLKPVKPKPNLFGLERAQPPATATDAAKTPDKTKPGEGKPGESKFADPYGYRSPPAEAETPDPYGYKSPAGDGQSASAKSPTYDGSYPAYSDPYAYKAPTYDHSYPDYSSDGMSTYTYTPPSYPTYTPK
jgi:hypothetical protein